MLKISERNKNQYNLDELKNLKKEIFNYDNQIHKNIKNYIAQRIEETLNLGSTGLMKLRTQYQTFRS
jgi:hypothetical protein